MSGRARGGRVRRPAAGGDLSERSGADPRGNSELATLPALGPSRAARRPTSAQRQLDSGLQVLAVRMDGVPLVEVRLQIPFAGRTATHRSASALLANSLLLGTAHRTELELVQALQELGTEVGVAADADRLTIGGTVLRSGLPALLDLLAEILTGAAYPAEPVDGEQRRLAEQVRIARAQPGVIAGAARARRLFGEHPYGRTMPEPDDVTSLTVARIRRLHRDRVQPGGAILVLVGDLNPQRTLDAVEGALAGWSAGSAPARYPAPPVERPAALLLVDRPGAVQSCLRLGGPAAPRTDPGHPALQLANFVFGGYFSSRFVANLREDKGYTYTPRSAVEHRQAGSTFSIDADVSTAVTAPALLETHYELGRMATLPVRQQEVDDARHYVLGTLAISTSTQAGLASTLVGLAGFGLGLDWLAAYRKALLAVSVDDVLEQARRFLAPSGLITVVVGDAAAVGPQLAAVAEITTE